tara:strand:- start:1066 stop:1524 length:459 start_codon:yes stop_codon:yes gene_type:complete
MNIVTTLDQFSSHSIYFADPIKNTVIPNSNFIRIYYSNNNFTLNGIYLLIDLYNTTTEKYYNKYKCQFSTSDNSEVVSQLISIENSILLKNTIPGKTPQSILSQQLRSGYMKLFAENNSSFPSNMKFILKISGLWENISEYGITYKFIPVTN